MVDREREDVRLLWVCQPCIAGEGSECHTPGCAFWMRDVPRDGANADMASSEDEMRAQLWPCDNYTPPITCLDAPSSEAARCNFCQSLAEPIRAERDALAERLAQVERLAESGIAAEARAVAEVEAERDALAATVDRVCAHLLDPAPNLDERAVRVRYERARVVLAAVWDDLPKTAGQRIDEAGDTPSAYDPAMIEDDESDLTPAVDPAALARWLHEWVCADDLLHNDETGEPGCLERADALLASGVLTDAAQVAARVLFVNDGYEPEYWDDEEAERDLYLDRARRILARKVGRADSEEADRG